MCTSGNKFSRAEIYKAIQATVAHIPLEIQLWLLKHKDSENRLHFRIEPKLKISKYEIKIIEYGGKMVKLKSLIDQAVIKGLIIYANWNFLLYPLNTPPPKTKFFNLFLRFLAKPVIEINKEIMDLIL